MRSQKMLALVAVVIAVATLLPAITHAQRRGRLTRRYATRHLTLPDAAMRFDLPLIFTIDDRDPDPGDNDTLDFMGGLAVGVTRDFELSAQVLPVRFLGYDNGDCGRFRSCRHTYYAPLSMWLPHLGQADLGLTWRFARGVAEVGVRADFILPVHDFGAQIGLPILIHAGDVLRIDVTPSFLLYFSDPTFWRFSVPVEFGISLSNAWFIGFEGGVHVYRGGGTELPFGFFFGIALGGGRPVLDIRAFVRMVDVQDGFDVWQTGVAFTIYAFL